MKKSFIFKFLISFFILFCMINVVSAKENVFVSLSPALTEIMFEIGAQDGLKGVSTACTYPKEAMLKEKVGDNFFINSEKIIKIKPDYILAMDTSTFMLNKFKKFGIKPLCFKNPDIKSVLDNIVELGKLTGRNENAQTLVNKITQKINSSNLNHNHKILYLIQVTPMISIGKKSFITDVIQKSGNISVTSGINSFYPTISEEFAISVQPDVVVLTSHADIKKIKKFFPKAEIVVMSKEENDIINRPGARIYKSVEFFAKL